MTKPRFRHRYRAVSHVTGEIYEGYEEGMKEFLQRHGFDRYGAWELLPIIRRCEDLYVHDGLFEASGRFVRVPETPPT